MKGLIFSIYLIWHGQYVLGALDCSSFSSTSERYLRHPVLYNKFYTCEYGVAQVFNCPDGLLFNSRIQGCDLPYEAVCGEVTTEAPVTCPPCPCETDPPTTTPTPTTTSCKTDPPTTTPPPTTTSCKTDPPTTTTSCTPPTTTSCTPPTTTSCTPPTTTTSCTPKPSPCDNPCAGLDTDTEIVGGYSKCPDGPIGDKRIHLEVPGQCGWFIQCDNFKRAFCKRCAASGLVFDRSVDPDACIWAYDSNRKDCTSTS